MDVLIRVCKFLIPFNFVIMDFDADRRVSIILRYLFLTTIGELIDMREGTITIR